MKSSNYTIHPFFDARTLDAKRQGNVMLTINLRGEGQFRISLKVKCTQAEFKSAVNTKSVNAKELRKVIQDYLLKAEQVFERLPNVSKDAFLRLFRSESDLLSNNKTDVFYFYDIRINEAIDELRYATANLYSDCKRALKLFRDNVYFEDIDEKFLKAYQTYMIGLGNTISTISIRLRHLKSIYNLAIKQGFISDKNNPFSKFKIANSTKSKDVLYPEQIKKLWEYQPVGIMQSRAKDYWFFCYLANGLNFKDFCCLRNRNIKGNTITFIREKTKNTTANVQNINVFINDELKRIIDTWRNPDTSPNAYLFPIYSKCNNVKHMERTKFKIKRECNKMLKRIGTSLGFELPITMHLARHSFATTLKLNGTPISHISDAMGHSNMNTTQHYLKSLPTEHLKTMSESLLQF